MRRKLNSWTCRRANCCNASPPERYMLPTAPWPPPQISFAREISPPCAHSRLHKNLELARELGAEVITTSDQDVVTAILRVARQQNVTQIVVGKPAGWRVLDLFHGGSVLNRLIRGSGNIDVYCVRAETRDSATPTPLAHWRFASTFRQYVLALGSVAVTTGLNFLLQN